jgi:predicted ATPase
MIESNQIEYNPLQSEFVEELSSLQKLIENYEPIWRILRKKIKTNIPENINGKKALQSRFDINSPNNESKSFFVGLQNNQISPRQNNQNNILNVDSNSKIMEELLSHKPLGLYAWGGPGCGKTFLLDHTYDLLETDYKKRMHFNEFMLRIHHSNHKFSKVIFLKSFY